MRSKYVMGVFLALTFGSGIALWRATDEIDLRIEAATHLAAMAQLTAEEQAKTLSEMLEGETKAREIAEQAQEDATNRAAEVAQKLAEQIEVTRNIRASLADAGAQVQALTARLMIRKQLKLPG